MSHLQCVGMDSPRPVEQRIADARQRLQDDVDAWVATTNGSRPWLVPLSFLWYGGQLLFATSAKSPTCLNLGVVPRTRVALGSSRDVVIVEGEAVVSLASTLTAAEVERYQAKLRSDPRTWADSVIRVTPARIQAWREENELSGRLLMREKAWIA